MRALIQKVTEAQVAVDGKVVSKIASGLLVLLGISETDTREDLEFLCRKVLNVRLFDNEKTGKPWNWSVMSANKEVLIVSQFTLYAKLKGNKPDFHQAMNGERSEPMYEDFLALARRTHAPDKIKAGVFGAMMHVSLTNDGPVTIQITTDDMVKKSSAKAARTKGHEENKNKVV